MESAPSVDLVAAQQPEARAGDTARPAGSERAVDMPVHQAADVDQDLVSGASGGSAGAEAVGSAETPVDDPGMRERARNRVQALVENVRRRRDEGRERRATTESGGYLSGVEWKEISPDVMVSGIIPAESANAPRACENGEMGEPVEGAMIRVSGEMADRVGLPRYFEHEGNVHIAVSKAEMDWTNSFMAHVLDRAGDLADEAGVEAPTTQMLLDARDQALTSYGDEATRARAEDALARVTLYRSLNRAQDESAAEASLKEYIAASASGTSEVYNENWRELWGEQGQTDAEGDEQVGSGDGGSSSVRGASGSGTESQTGSGEEPAEEVPVLSRSEVADSQVVAESAPGTELHPDAQTETLTVGDVSVEGITSPGHSPKYEDENYDGMVMFETVIDGEPVAVAAVLDGVSKNRGAVELVRRNLKVAVEHEVSTGMRDPTAILKMAMTEMSQQVMSRPALGNATVAAAIVGPGWRVVGRAGDTTAYRDYVDGATGARRYGLEQVSWDIDHPAGESLNVISNALGEPDFRFHVSYKEPLLPGRSIFLATDGFGVPYDEQNNPVDTFVMEEENPSLDRLARRAEAAGLDNYAGIRISYTGNRRQAPGRRPPSPEATGRRA